MDKIDSSQFARSDERERENQNAITGLVLFATNNFSELDKDRDNIVTRQELGLARNHPQIDQQKLAMLEINFDTLKSIDSSQPQGLTKSALDEAFLLLLRRRDTFLRAVTIRDGLLYNFERLDQNRDQNLSYSELDAGRPGRAVANGSSIAALYAINELRELGRPMGGSPLGVMAREDFVVSREDLVTYPTRALRRCDPRLDRIASSLVGEQRLAVPANVNSVGVPDTTHPLSSSTLIDYAGIGTAGAGAAALRFFPRSGSAVIGAGALYQGYRDADRLFGSHGTGLDAAALIADTSIAAGSVAFLMKSAGKYKIPLLAGGITARIGLEFISRK